MGSHDALSSAGLRPKRLAGLALPEKVEHETVQINVASEEARIHD
ncbi:hypothetical protein [Sinorhizobium meliloti]|nr:hypothetical protein [Sinorhizobium meliloti]